ncbi:hypothetical protein FPRO05_00211 [Fusarium proliferatum]|uniref:SnoaL-like domain-containing protein n=1 Tax=Gibberella intermedia TaxID=948311 RepID=A0A365NM28_GIBIN|nr:hypothetical protein FPRO05_00211 [Fusarium proliferatum]
MASPEYSPLEEELFKLYREYRETKSIDAKALFFSSQCRQICRTDPAYAAKGRDTILHYLRESGDVLQRIYREAGWNISEMDPASVKSFYTMRPLVTSEKEDFATIRELAPAGFASLEEVRDKARSEKWDGLRVNMWTEDNKGRGILVKVQYWWREEDGAWKQILHDIMFLGPVDGTEKDGRGILVEEGV